MYGVMMPGVSAGSNHVGAIDTWTAQVSWPSGASERPSGAAGAVAGPGDPRSKTTTRTSNQREIEWRNGWPAMGASSVPKSSSTSRTVQDRNRGTTTGTRSEADYPRTAVVVNPPPP